MISIRQADNKLYRFVEVDDKNILLWKMLVLPVSSLIVCLSLQNIILY